MNKNSHKFKIAIMLPKLSKYGGVENFAWRLAEALATNYEVHFICSQQKEQAPAGVTVKNLGRPPWPDWLKVAWFAYRAEKIRQKGGYDLSIGLGNSIRQDILRLSGAPTPLFWQYSQKAYPAGFWRNFKMLRRKLSPAKRLKQYIEKKQIQYSKLIIANSHLVQELTIKTFPAAKSKIKHIIYNQPDLSCYHPCTFEQKLKSRVKLGLPGTAKVVSTAGTNFMLKGITQLVQAMPLLSNDYHLIIAGGRNSRKYIKQAKKLKIENRVHFLGKIGNMQTVYQASDVFILNSFYDACSNAVLEALASGIPTISTRINGSSIFLNQKLIIEHPEDVQSISEMILKASSISPKKYLSLQHKNIEKGINSYLKIIKDYINQKYEYR